MGAGGATGAALGTLRVTHTATVNMPYSVIGTSSVSNDLLRKYDGF